MIVHLLAHFDDEYCAVPLILANRRAGLDQRFVYVADYASPEVTRVRMAETRAFLSGLGIAPEKVIHAASQVADGALHHDPLKAFAAARAAVNSLGPASGFVTTAWEGGHADHDLCAAMTVALAGGRPIQQISLYQGRNTPGPLFATGDPIPENGPATRIPLPLADWLAWALAVRRYPSQWKSWAGLWPTMFASYLRRGFCVQALAPARVLERPHLGRLLYERRFGVAYEAVRAAADEILALRPGRA